MGYRVPREASSPGFDGCDEAGGTGEEGDVDVVSYDEAGFVERLVGSTEGGGGEDVGG